MADELPPADAPLGDEAGLRTLFAAPSEFAVKKQLDRLDRHCRNFIAHSPFLVIGSTRPDRGTDVSPRGDAPGFVQVIDDRTLAIPDRPGNNRLDTMTNLLRAPEVGLIFFIPGIDETLRVNGTARIARDAALLARAEVQGKRPNVAIVVAVREAFLHCGKALKRARLWSADFRVDAGAFPSLGRMIADQVGGMSVETAEAAVEESYKKRLY